MKVALLGQAAPLDPDRIGLPLYETPVPAGFPSPATEQIERHLDLHRHVVRHASATFFLTACGDSMLGAGIHSGDLLVVDREIAAEHNRIVIAALDGELTCKRLVRSEDGVFLMPENPEFEAIDITHREYVFIWGVVTHVIHKL